MSGACSRKRDQQVNEDGVYRAISGRCSKSGSSKWLGTLISRGAVDIKIGNGKCPSLMELCIRKICQEIHNYSSFWMLPRDISHQIINELACSQLLTDATLEAFRDCALQDIYFGGYPGFSDRWLDVVSSQGPSLLSINLSGSDVADSGLNKLKDCKNLQFLDLNYCDQISDHGLKCITGLTLSLKRNSNVTAQGMSAFSNLVNLLKLDLERCPGVHGGLVHLKGMSKLESLNINCCNCITDADMKPISELTSLKGLQISSRLLITVSVFGKVLASLHAWIRFQIIFVVCFP